jgi:hypothetical protein
VAHAAGVSLSAAYRALAITPQLADVAAAVDSIQVLRVIPRSCAFCREPFPWISGMPYCSTACSKAAEARRLHHAQLDRSQDRPRQPPEVSAHPEKRIRELPRPPDWSQGLCTTVPSRMRAWWTSEIRTEREAAALMCQGCPVLAECGQWSLSLPLDDGTVYAGMSAAERRRRVRALRDEIIRQVTSARPGRRLP